MNRLQFRVLYRDFLFRVVDLELLSSHAEGDSRTLLGQFASVLVSLSLTLAVWAGFWVSRTTDDQISPLAQIIGSWSMEHFLIATTMLVVRVFAVLSWRQRFRISGTSWCL